MKHFSVSHISAILRLMLVLAAIVPTALWAEGANSLYLRAINGDWDAPVSEEYKMTLVKSEGDYQVYNWTGKIPTSFVIGNEDFSICLSSESNVAFTGPTSEINSILPTSTELIQISPKEESSEEPILYLSLSNIKDAFQKGRDNTLLLIKSDNKFTLVACTALQIRQVITDTNVIKTDMWAYFDKGEVIYECVCDLLYGFGILNDETGIFNKTNSGFFVEKNKTYTLITGNSNSPFSPEPTLSYYNVLCRIRYHYDSTKGSNVSTFEITDAPPIPEVAYGYGLMRMDGFVEPFEKDEEGRLRAECHPGNEGFVVVTYNDGAGSDSPTSDDVTGYYTNKGGVTYYYDEKLTYYEGSPSTDGSPAYTTDGQSSAYMLLAEDHPSDSKLTFFFTPAENTSDGGSLRLSCETDCVHIPIYFYSESFSAPHIRAVNSEGRLYTGLEGSAMTQHDVTLFGGDDKLWRFDLWIPADELSQHVSKQSPVSGLRTSSGTISKNDVILPETASGASTPSNLHLTFTDGATASGQDHDYRNAPLVPGGVYALSVPGDDVTIPNEVYLMYEEGSEYKVLTTLERAANGAYSFDGQIPISSESSVQFFVSTSAEGSIDKSYGAPEGVTAIEISNALNSADDSHNYNGDMVKDSQNCWVIDLDNISGSTQKSMAVRVQISPDGYYGISFGFSSDDFQTQVESVIPDEGEEYWFSLQGERLAGPRPGIMIRVTPKGASKVLIQ